MLPYIPQYDPILLGNHGSVCYGDDVYKAFFKMETVAHFARVALVADLLGGPRVLPRHEMGKPFEARARYGVTSHNRMEPSRPIVAQDNAAQDLEDHGRLTITRAGLIALLDEALRSQRLDID